MSFNFAWCIPQIYIVPKGYRASCKIAGLWLMRIVNDKNMCILRWKINVWSQRSLHEKKNTGKSSSLIFMSIVVNLIYNCFLKEKNYHIPGKKIYGLVEFVARICNAHLLIITREFLCLG